MAAKRRLIVGEDFDRGYGSTTIPTDSGGTRVATKVGLQTFSGVISVVDTGADSTGVADSSTAVSNALTLGASLYPNGFEIYFPPGNYKLNSTVTLNVAATKVTLPIGTVTCAGSPAFSVTAARCCIHGHSRDESIVVTSSATADIMQISADSCFLADFTLRSSVSRSAGGGIALKSTGNVVAERIRIDPVYNGIQGIEASTSGHFKNILMNTSGSSAGNWNAGVIIGGYVGSTTTADWIFQDISISTQSTWAAGAAVILDSGLDTCHFDHLSIVKDTADGVCILIQHTGSGGINAPRWLRFMAAILEGGTTAEAISMTSGSDVRFVDSYIATSLIGLHLNGTGGFPVGVVVINTHFENIQRQAILLEGWSSFDLATCDCSGTSQAGNGSYPAIEITPGANSGVFKITGMSFLPMFNYTNFPNYYIKIGAGTVNSSAIIFNEFRAAYRTVGNISNASTGVGRWIGPNGEDASVTYLPGQVDLNSISTGTQVFSITSTTPVTNLTCGPTAYNSAATQIPNTHVVTGTGTADAGGLLTVNLTGAAAFTSSGTYVVSGMNRTGVFAVQPTRVSGSQFTLQTRASADQLEWFAVGA